MFDRMKDGWRSCGQNVWL